MFIFIFCLGMVIAPIYCIIDAIAGKKKKDRPKAAPRRQHPIDKYMDEVYGDIDWLRKGKL